ncbi:MAG: Tol-Pal system protein TolB [Hyphomicrobiaceae bacterium hypho_1]
MKTSIGSYKPWYQNGISRREMIRIFSSSFAACIAPATLTSQTRVTIDKANPKPVLLAVPLFFGDNKRLGTAISNIIQADLERSGIFSTLKQKKFVQQMNNIDVTPRFQDWRSIGVEAVIIGRTLKIENGNFQVHFRLWDIVLGQLLIEQKFSVLPKHWRRLGHLVSDQIYQKLTFEQGYFDTRIVFIDETGPKQKRLKRLAIMDQDGHNLQILSDGSELVITPRFNPMRQEITYMSYVKDQPRVFMMDLTSGQKQVVGDFPGMTFAPRFSPDGKRVIMSVQHNTSSWIVEIDLKSRRSRHLTRSDAIDTSPCFHTSI